MAKELLESTQSFSWNVSLTTHFLDHPLPGDEERHTRPVVASRNFDAYSPLARKLLRPSRLPRIRACLRDAETSVHGMDCCVAGHRVGYDDQMYAQKFKVELVIRGNRRACPLEWLDQFCMRNFTNAAEFDDTLPSATETLQITLPLTPH